MQLFLYDKKSNHSFSLVGLSKKIVWRTNLAQSHSLQFWASSGRQSHDRAVGSNCPVWKTYRNYYNTFHWNYHDNSIKLIQILILRRGHSKGTYSRGGFLRRGLSSNWRNLPQHLQSCPSKPTAYWCPQFPLHFHDTWSLSLSKLRKEGVLIRLRDIFDADKSFEDLYLVVNISIMNRISDQL